MGTKKKSCQGFKSNVKSLDQFGKPISFVLEDGKQTYDSLCGACLTFSLLVLAIVMLIQFVYVNEPIRLHPIEFHQERLESDVFSAKENQFNVAFALKPFDPDVVFNDNGKVAQLKPYMHTWGLDKTGKRFSKLKELDSELCSTLELGVTDQKDKNLKQQFKFFPTSNANLKDMKEFANQFQCIDASEVDLYGNSDSMEGSALVVNLELCQGEGCLAVNIDDYFADLFILMLSNQSSYRITEEDGLKVKDHSFLNWIPVSTQVRSTFEYEVSTAVLKPDRSIFSIIKEDDQEFF